MDLRERIAGLMGQVRAELAELVAIPSVADPRQFPPEECARAARWVQHAFAAAGFADAWLAEMSDGSQAVLGSRPCADPDAATVLLYSHYDVQPPLNEAAWRTPPFELTEVDGRWYGRGTADCKGNILMHLAALRALGDQVPVNLKLVVEGSEETTGALEEFVPGHADLLCADAILIGDGGNAAVGQPAVTREPARRGGRDGACGRARVGAAFGHVRRGGSRRPGGAGRDAGHAPGCTRQHYRARAGQHPGVARCALPRRDVPCGRRCAGGGVPSRRRRGGGHGQARLAVTILGIDCPPVVGSTAAITPRASAKLNLRVPPGMHTGEAAEALVRHLHAVAPWGVRVTAEIDSAGPPFAASTGGPAYQAIAAAMREAYGRPMVTLGDGGSIPLCSALADAYPDAEVILLGVVEPLSLIHAPNESVDPAEIAAMALTEALFLQRYAAIRR